MANLLHREISPALPPADETMHKAMKWIIRVGGLTTIVLLATVDVVDCPCMTEDQVARCYVSSTAKTALWGFKMATGRYPVTAEGLQALVTCPLGLETSWHGPYLELTSPPLDPWNHEYHCACPGSHHPTSYDVWSLGPDGVESADDIGNW